MKSFRVSLPDDVYARLKTAAKRAGMPATAIAREAIDRWLRQQRRNARYDAIAAYVSETAGTPLDLDTDLEAAGIELL